MAYYQSLVQSFACALLLSSSFASHADDATVGNGLPSSCTTTAFNNAMNVILSSQGPAGTLTFNCGFNPRTIVVPETFLTGQITIDGGGLITLDGNNTNRIFNVSQTNPEDQTSILIKNITLTRGFAPVDFGGAIVGSNAVVITLDNVLINNSRAAISGGAVAMNAGTFLNVARSAFRNNTAQSGGAMAIRSRTVIESSQFSLNTASSTGTAGIGEGGAIQSYDSDLFIRDSQFSFNLGRRGGVIYKQSALLVVENSRLVDNSANEDGGAIFVESNTGVRVFNSTFERNVAPNGEGGALQSFGNIIVRQCTFNNNRAQVGGAVSLSGGSILLFDDSTLSNNVASFRGGAIDAINGAAALNLNQLTFSNNSVSNATNGAGADLALEGIAADLRLSTLIGGSAVNGSSVLVNINASLALQGNAIAVTNGVACATLSNGVLTNNGINIGPASCFGNPVVNSFAGLGLGEFADYGGNQLNYMPLPGSVLLDRIACIGDDARIKPRAVDIDGNGSALCDIGAIERQIGELPASLFRDGFE
jgi:hypothetical protein